MGTRTDRQMKVSFNISGSARKVKLHFFRFFSTMPLRVRYDLSQSSRPSRPRRGGNPRHPPPPEPPESADRRVQFPQVPQRTATLLTPEAEAPPVAPPPAPHPDDHRPRALVRPPGDPWNRRRPLWLAGAQFHGL